MTEGRKKTHQKHCGLSRRSMFQAQLVKRDKIPCSAIVLLMTTVPFAHVVPHLILPSEVFPAPSHWTTKTSGQYVNGSNMAYQIVGPTEMASVRTTKPFAAQRAWCLDSGNTRSRQSVVKTYCRFVLQLTLSLEVRQKIQPLRQHGGNCRESFLAGRLPLLGHLILN